MGSPNNRGIGGINVSKCLRSLVRRKQVDSEGASSSSSGHNQLAKALSIPHLIAIGVGSTIGAGVYILIGTVAREDTGPALTLSFLIAGIAAALSAFCYAELASRCPCAGSAYHYSYICVGECVAWLIGWALILEYTLGGSAVARGISPNLALLLGGKTSLPFFLARHYIPDLDMTVDPCAAILVFIITVLLCFGIKESMLVNSIVTSANVGAMIFIIVVGGYLGYTSGWTGYGLPSGFFPYGVDGMLAGSATVFFAYVGFDSVASAAEEVKNPKKDLPLGIALSLAICCTLYMLVSVVIVGLVPYYHLNPDTPISSAFASHGMQWAAYVVTAGTITALCSSLVGSILPQPRILMAMARDGLLPPFFSDVNKRYQVPIKSTVATGIAAAALAFFMEVSQLAGMVSVGTLLAFTMVAISVLIVRYVPPNEVPVSSSLQGSVDEISSRHSHAIANSTTDEDGSKPSPLPKKGTVKPMSAPLILKQVAEGNLMFSDQERRIVAGWTIVVTCIGVVILTSAASIPQLPSILRYVLCGLGGAILLCGLIILTSLDQDDARHSFGHSGGFICPMVPLLPIICILINVYLLINLGGGTWKRVSMWLAVGVLIYVSYGRSHSTLRDTVYVPKAHVDEIYKSSHDTLISV